MTEARRRAGAEPQGRPRVSGLVLTAVGVLCFGLLGAYLMFFGGPGSDDSTGDRSVAEGGAPAADGKGAAEEKPTATASAEPVDDKALERFARAYVRIASRNPKRGLALLTADYRGASPRYLEVWSRISDPRILEVEGDPDTLSVTYTYTYSYSGRPRTEEVTLRLVKRGDSFLIAGGKARPH
ncbi:hypothetical protein JK386_10140 [Nocardioides sp. zg-536]|uniref:Uncharacterized protein n=1 Tax=Nocardioides faecalis TaxID=2803858 RepID=A0A938Y580_9ACTN|nr:hypothetical protein [Nocardioides faecalis]MBM9460263.1 hypothetical protein [Nocardioides faecalis]QVI59896.1 hypothetical protein KG111_06120 [Nocardioides faecalis]